MAKYILSAFADEINMDLQRQMDVLLQHDIHYMEMRGVYGRNLLEYSLDEVRAFKKKLDAMEVRVSAIGSPIGKIGITDPFPPHMELFKHAMEIAEILETNYIRMFSFYIPQDCDPAAYRAEVMDRWGAFVQAAEGRGLVLLHENEKGIYGDTPERCLDLMKTMNSSAVKATFDPANFVQCDVETYPKAFEMLREHIAYVHIKDAVYRDHHVTPAGDGDGRVDEILQALFDSGYSGFISIEPHLTSFDGMETLERNIVSSKPMTDSNEIKFAIAVAALRKILYKSHE